VAGGGGLRLLATRLLGCRPFWPCHPTLPPMLDRTQPHAAVQPPRALTSALVSYALLLAAM
jgi:hypothetical protein